MEHPKIWDPLHISATVEASNFKFGTQLGFGTSLLKTFCTKIGGGLGQGASKNWDPYLFLKPLKLATSNLVHNLGLGLAYQITTFRNKIGGGLNQGSIQKIWDPYVFWQSLKLAFSNLVHKLGLGLAYQKTTFRTKIGRGLG